MLLFDDETVTITLVRLSPRQEKIIRMHYGLGENALPLRTIARLLGLKNCTVRYQWRKALVLIREQLDGTAERRWKEFEESEARSHLTPIRDAIWFKYVDLHYASVYGIETVSDLSRRSPDQLKECGICTDITIKYIRQGLAYYNLPYPFPLSPEEEREAKKPRRIIDNWQRFLDQEATAGMPPSQMGPPSSQT